MNKIFGILNAVQSSGEDSYMKTIQEKAVNILGKKDSISLNKLMNNSVFKEIYNKLDDNAKSKANTIFSMDGDAQNVSERELQTFFTLLDANLENVNGKETFVFDNEDSFESTNGLSNARENEIQIIYNNTKSRADEKMEKMREQEEIKKQQEVAIQKEKQIQKEIKDVKVYDDDGNLNDANLLKVLKSLSNAGSEVLEKVCREIFGDRLNLADLDRSGGFLIDLKDTKNEGRSIIITRDMLGNVSIRQAEDFREYDANGDKVK